MNPDIERTRATRREAVLAEIAFLKSTDSLSQLHARSIALPSGGALLPVCELHTDDGPLISDLARWRASAQFAFPTRFPVSTEGTRRWLRAGLLDVADRVLFLVCDRHGHAVGHLGFAAAGAADGSMEIDNVVRGERAVSPGLMGEALDALIAWADELFAPERILLHVFEDNGHAIGFYRRHGFVDAGRVPLVRTVDGEREVFIPAGGEQSDAAFLVMERHAPAEAPAGEQILTAGPSVSARESGYVLDAARTGWNASWSGYLDRLESTFAEYVGAKHAIATSSCTGALHLAVAGAGIGPGDEVIVPELTWVATASAVLYRGGTPIFADVEPDSWCVDPESVRSLITPQTRAIMPVHLYGHPAQADVISQIADEHGLTVIEDAAPAIGAELRGRRVGTFGDVACFSFQGAKLLVTGEGGMIVTDDEELVDQIRSLWDHGRDRSRAFWIEQLGFKYKMSNLQAAFGLGQLERVDQLIEAKRRIFAWYRDGLEDVPGITLNHEAPWARSIYWMTSIRVGPESGLDREALIAHLREAKIDTRPVFTPISQYPFWPRRQAAQPVATAIGSEGINLPSGVALRRAQVERVCAEIRRAVAAASRRAA
jgi:perosamine synthetase